MRNVELSPKLVSQLLFKRGIRFVSGKWFYKNNQEIKNIERYMLRMEDLDPYIDSVDDVQKVIRTFIAMYGEDGWWPQMPIIKEAMALPKSHAPAFPLSRKQLLIIKKLLQGDEEYMFILCGIGGSGKSTFANIVCQIFDGDVSHLTLTDLSNEFLLADGINSRLIYADELNADDLDNGKIKTLVSKQCIVVNPKNQRPFRIRWQGNLFFSCNKEPRIDLKDSGLVRRICYFNMDEKIKNPDKTLQKKEYKHDDLVNIVRLALDEPDENWFDEFKIETRYLLRKNNSVWLSKDEKVGVKDTPYESYKVNALRQGFKVLNEPNFLEIRKVLGEWEEEENAELPF